MTITILTPIYNDEATLADSLAAIDALAMADSVQHILIDDGSTDASADIAKKHAQSCDRVTYVSKKNGGEASALNEGLRHATAELCAILEADVEPESDWLATLVPEFEDPTVAGAGGILITPRDDPWAGRIGAYEMESKFYTQERHPAHVTSAAAIYRTDVLRAMNGFREDLVNSTLDVDLNQRVIAAGHRLAYNPNARAVHHYKSSLGGYLRRVYAYGRYRPFLRSQVLYPRDRGIALQMLLTIALVASLPLMAWKPWLPLVPLGAILVAHAPMLGRLFSNHKDPVLLALPFVMILRNLVGLAGLALGFFDKVFLRSGRRR